ncbi:MAG: hypothetical protein U5R31_05995 [Acidimicrobiia bacterium]|nr:hypothetical protein [Acidimicrobiia bacterium]
MIDMAEVREFVERPRELAGEAAQRVEQTAQRVTGRRRRRPSARLLWMLAGAVGLTVVVAIVVSRRSRSGETMGGEEFDGDVATPLDTAQEATRRGA